MRPKQTIGKRLLKKAKTPDVKALLSHYRAKKVIRDLINEGNETINDMAMMRKEYHQFRDFRKYIPDPSPYSILSREQ